MFAVFKIVFSLLFLIHISLSIHNGLGSIPVNSRPAFLPSEYEVNDEPSTRFNVRQVPGDGGCLFHSLAVCIRYLKDKDHPPSFDVELRELSDKLRKISVKILRSPSTCLSMEGGEEILSSELLKMVAVNYNMSEIEYLQQMLIPNTWGGGPEIVALSNHFKRPIHVYELHSYGTLRKQFQLKICAKFGSPHFDSKSPLQILCADGRFPNVSPGKQKEIGDHFLALFPCPSLERNLDAIKTPNKIRSERDVDAIKTSKPNKKRLTGSKWLEKTKVVDEEEH